MADRASWWWVVASPGSPRPRPADERRGARRGGARGRRPLRRQDPDRRRSPAGPSTRPPTPSWPGCPTPSSCASELGLADELVTPAARNAYLYSLGELRPLPRRAWCWACPPTSTRPRRAGRLGGDQRRGRRPGRPRPHHGTPTRSANRDADGGDESVGSLVRRRLGDEVYEVLVGPLLSGVNAATSTSSAWPPAPRSSTPRPCVTTAASSPGLGRSPRPPAARPPRGPPGVLRATRRHGPLVDALVADLSARGVELREAPERATELRPRAAGGVIADRSSGHGVPPPRSSTWTRSSWPPPARSLPRCSAPCARRGPRHGRHPARLGGHGGPRRSKSRDRPAGSTPADSGAPPRGAAAHRLLVGLGQVGGRHPTVPTAPCCCGPRPGATATTASPTCPTPPSSTTSSTTSSTPCATRAPQHGSGDTLALVLPAVRRGPPGPHRARSSPSWPSGTPPSPSRAMPSAASASPPRSAAASSPPRPSSPPSADPRPCRSTCGKPSLSDAFRT